MSDRDDEVDPLAEAVTRDLREPERPAEPPEVVVPEKYEYLETIGRGGFGIVYLARDKTLHRLVALKFLLDASPLDVERLRREARYTARLDDPVIVNVYELGESAGQPYIAMQYIDGGSLREATLAHRELARVIRDVARALHRCHQAGIVHRDIKPANILLDGQRRAYLTDFGIARDLRNDPAETESEGGLVMGTPALMSPEQARGDMRSVDARSDVYALGATLFAELTGSSPFTGAHVVAVLNAVITEEPPAPRAFDAQIPGALEAIVLRCMRKEKEGRYRTMAELADELDRFLAGQPVQAEAADRFREAVGAAPPPQVATGPDPSWAEGVDIARELAAWDAELYRVRGSLEQRHARLDEMIGRLDRILADQPDLAWARFYRGEALFRRGRLPEALEDMERAVDRMGDLASAHFELGKLYLTLFLRVQQRAHLHLSRAGADDELKAARARLDQAVVAFREAQRLKGDLPPWQIDYANSVGLLADGDSKACVRACDRLLERDPDLDEVWKLRGDALYLAGEDPFESYDHAIAVRKSSYEAWLAKAEVHHERREWAAAKEDCERALAIFPGLSEARALMGRILLEQARDGAGEAAVGEALQHLLAALKTDLDSYEVNVVLAELQLERGRDPKRADWLERALDTLARARRLEGCPNRVDLLRARVLLQRARHAIAAGKVRRARADLDEILDNRGQSHAEIPDDDSWRRVIEEAAADMARLEAD